MVFNAVAACAGGCHATEEVQGQVQWEPSWGHLGVLEADGSGLPTTQPLSVT